MLKIITKSYIFYFKNAFYDEEAGIIKTIFNKPSSSYMFSGSYNSNSVIFDYIEMQLYLENIMNSCYNINEKELFELLNNLNLFTNDNKLQNIIKKISNTIIHQINNPILIKIKHQIMHIFSYSTSNNDNIEDNYKKLWFLFNHFDSVIKKPTIYTKNTNFTIFDYIFDNI
jgi:hypothetical protein